MKYICLKKTQKGIEISSNPLLKRGKGSGLFFSKENRYTVFCKEGKRDFNVKSKTMTFDS